jgi:hypothetical protein
VPQVPKEPKEVLVTLDLKEIQVTLDLKGFKD